MTAARQLETDTDDPLDMIAELVDAHRHRVYVRRDADQHGTVVATWHRVRVPSLIDQLDPRPGGDSAPSAGGYRSQPAARVDTLDTWSTIDTQVTRWMNRYDVDQTHLDLAQCVRRLGALMAGWDRAGHRCHRRAPAIDRATDTVTCCTWHSAARDIRRWWARARIVTGWDEPAWRPDVSCPACGMLGALGVRLRERVATCVECHEGWGPTSYQQLADHVRTESLARAAAGRPMPCSRVPGYDPPIVVAVPGLRLESALWLCPACGSSRCQRAVAARPDQSGPHDDASSVSPSR